MRRRLLQYALSLIALLATGHAWVSSGVASAAGQQEPLDLSPAEQWVIERVQLGEVADLIQFGDGLVQVLSPRFLEDLLTGSLEGVTVHLKGVRVANATIPGPLDLERADIVHYTQLDRFSFRESVNLSKSVFRKGITIDNSWFNSADFNEMNVKGNAYFRGTIFGESVDFTSAAIDGFFLANNAYFAESASFDRMRVDKDLALTSAVFSGRVTFSETNVTGRLVVSRAHFLNGSEVKQFSGMKVGGDAIFGETVFSGPAVFVGAKIDENFEADDARFGASADFSHLEVGGSAIFGETVFSGPAMFVGAKIDGNFEADHARFDASADFSDVKVGGSVIFGTIDDGGSILGKTVFSKPVEFENAEINRDFEAVGTRFVQRANFSGMKVGGSAFFKDAVFAGAADFAGANIGGDFQATRADFTDSQEGANLADIKVGKTASFFQAVFWGPVGFASADITLDLNANAARFTNGSAEANFGSMKVGGSAVFFDAMFEGPVDFTNAHVGSFNADGARFADRKTANFSGMTSDIAFFRGAAFLGTAEFSGMTSDNAFFRGAVFLGTADFNEVEVTRAYFNGTTFVQEVSMIDSDFQTIRLRDVFWPRPPIPIRLNGMTYRNIHAGDDEDSWKDLLELLSRSVYHPNPYANLEEFFRKGGEPAKADSVFIAQKRRERDEVLGGRTQWRWWRSQLQDTMVLFGLSAQRVFIWALIPLALGTVLFRTKYMVPDRPENIRKYNPFWYSLDLFLPFIDLQAAKYWSPSSSYGLQRHYMLIHTFVGWILIPIGLLALTGVFR